MAKNADPELFRHGDVIIQSFFGEIPDNAVRQDMPILAYGERTGHSHQISPADAAVLFRNSDGMFLQVVADEAQVVHEEHKTIVLKKGTYRVWIQREYTPQRIEKVRD